MPAADMLAIGISVARDFLSNIFLAIFAFLIANIRTSCTPTLKSFFNIAPVFIAIPAPAVLFFTKKLFKQFMQTHIKKVRN